MLEGAEVNRRAIRYILLGGFALRFACAAWRHQPIAPGGDAETYLGMAQAFAFGRFPGQGHPPVFPLFLSLTYWRLGQNILLTLFIQSCVSAALIAMVYRIGTELGGEFAGLSAAAWVAVDPFLLFYNSVFLSETLFTTLLMTTFVLLLRTLKNASSSSAWICGLCLGTATLCRGILLPCIPFFPLSMIGYIRGPFRRRWLPALFCLAGVAFLLGGWSVYVHYYTGHWLMVDSHKGENMYWAIDPQLNNLAAEQQYLTAMKQDIARQGLKDPLEIDAYLMNKAMDWIRHHPGQYLVLMIRKFFKFWSLVPHREIYSPSQRLISIMFMLPLMLMAVAGLGVEFQNRPWPPIAVMILGFIGIYTLANIIIWTEIRYRVPIDPFLEIFAGAFIAQKIKKAGSPPANV